MLAFWTEKNKSGREVKKSQLKIELKSCFEFFSFVFKFTSNFMSSN